MVQREPGPAGLLRWLARANVSEIYKEARATANAEDVTDGLTMCDHILIADDLTDVLEARTRFLKGKLYNKLDSSKARDIAANQLSQGLDLAKGVISDKDPELIEARQLLHSIRPPDPDLELLEHHVDQLQEYWEKLYEQQDDDGVQECLRTQLPRVWRTLYYVHSFEAHVQCEGMATYFANTLGRDAQETIEAFRELNKNLASTVKKALALFEANERKHLRSREKRNQYRVNDIVRADRAPGRYKGDIETYSEIETRYCRQAQGLNRLLAHYIRTNERDFADSWPPCK